MDTWERPPANSDYLIENGVLTAYKGPGGEAAVPAGVKAIGDYAFAGCKSLTAALIPEGARSVGDHAFDGCENLTRADIPQSAASIGDYAFCGCKSLAAVSIPEGAAIIGASAFEGCENLTSAVLPQSAIVIDQSAFAFCKSLTSLILPQDLRIIEPRAFWGCENLTDLVLPENAVQIGSHAFYGCKSLGSVVLPKGVKRIGKSVFGESRPALIAPHIPIGNFCAEDKPGAACGFAKAYLDGAEIDEEIRAGYLRYIKSQKKRLYPLALRHEELLRLMLAENIPSQKDLGLLLEECESQQNEAAKAATLKYARQKGFDGVYSA